MVDNILGEPIPMAQPGLPTTADLQQQLESLRERAHGIPDGSPEDPADLAEDFLRLCSLADGKLSALRMLERRSSETELMFDSVMQYSPDCVTICDLQGNLKYLSEAGYRIFAMDRTLDIHTKNTFDFLSPLSKAKAYENVMRTLAGERIGLQEYEAVRMDGTRFWIESNGGLLKDGQNDPWGLLIITRDISDRRRNETLLRKATLEAETANQAKGNFLANMSHEIRTPMNAIIGFLELLMLSDLDEVQHSYANEVRHASSILLYLINDILDFSKIEAGKLEMETIPFSIRSVVEDCVTMNAPKAEQKGLAIHSLIHSGIPQQVIGDPGRLKQVLNNLISNAIKFTQRGEVIVSTAMGSNGSDEFIFTVEDTGIGIKPEHFGHIFDLFDQADTSTTRKFGGTGLGLAISRRLVELMMGRLELSSEYGKGSRFWFTARFEPDMAGQTPMNLSHAKLKGRRMLLVDGNETQRQILAQYLGEAGIFVQHAESVRESLDLLAHVERDAAPITTILLDNQQPDIEPALFPSMLHAIEACRNLPIVLITSVANKGDSKSAHESGFAGYISKPVRLSELLDCLSMIVQIAENPSTPKGDVLVTRHLAQEQRLLTEHRLLVAEDNPTNQKVVVMMLKKLGYHCDIAQNGSEAFDACQLTRYDVILMDCQMPVADGFAATRRIRAHSLENKNTPIIAMTANVMMGDREVCLAAGMNDYLPKPVNLQTLGDMLRLYLQEDDPVSA